MGKTCSPARPWTTSGTGSEQDVSMSRAPSRHDDAGQPPPMGHLYSMGKNSCSPDQSVAPVGSWQTQTQPTAPADREPRCTAGSPWSPPPSAWPQVGCWWSGPCCGLPGRPAVLRRRPGHRWAPGRWRPARRRREHPRGGGPGDLAGAPAAVAGDRGRRGDRVDHCWCRHGRGGGDHQPGPSTRAQTRFRLPTRSRYGAPPAAAVTALAHPGGEGEAVHR